jgi:hypothetical protein
VAEDACFLKIFITYRRFSGRFLRQLSFENWKKTPQTYKFLAENL